MLLDYVHKEKERGLEMNLIKIQKQINLAQFNANHFPFKKQCVIKKGNGYIVEEYKNQKDCVYISF